MLEGTNCSLSFHAYLMLISFSHSFFSVGDKGILMSWEYLQLSPCKHLPLMRYHMHMPDSPNLSCLPLRDQTSRKTFSDILLVEGILGAVFA